MSGDIQPRKGVVLIVDDEEVVRMALEMVLSDEGYRTMTAADGLEAIGIVEREKIDVVITDMKMPRADGMEVLRAVKAKSPETRVIMITGFASEDAEAARAEGADDFIYKVFRRAQIIESVRRLLGEDGAVPGAGSPPPEKT
jgi:CheY-like chemotaxis protein